MKFNNFTKHGPRLDPVESKSWWKDTRPGPKAMTHGVYNPVLEAMPEPRPAWCEKNPDPIKKPRNTV